jgi:17beta-estradiol 17-dehydrogenase / very-long-chain 3-oxoacyl-CoA reductase
MWFLISILPESFIDSLRLGMCIKIRKKGLAKDAKKKSL